MGAAHVQDIGLGHVTAEVNTITSANSGSPVTGGNTVVAFAWGFQSTNDLVGADVTCSDSAGNSYTQAFFRKGTNQWVVAFYCLSAIGGSSFNVTISIGNGKVTSLEVCAVELSGVSGSGQPDVAASTNSGSVAPATPGSITTATADCIILGVYSDAGSSGDAFTAPSGYTQIDRDANGNSFDRGQAVYKLLTGTATENPSWAIANVRWAAGAVALKPGAGGGGIFPYWLHASQRVIGGPE